MTIRHFPVTRLVILALAALAAAGCAGSGPLAETGQRVSIMAFNVENLFDNVDDPAKDDATYLALADKQDPLHIAGCNEVEVDRWRDQCLNWDWSDAVVDRKLAAVAAAILAAGSGRGPDIVALQEIENLAIAERLRTEYLGAADYRPVVLVEGDDARGIDVAFLTRLPIVGAPTLHPVAFDDTVPAERIADTRGILEATFVLPDGSRLTGFSVHFPAPFHPTEMRERAYRTLDALLEALPADRPAFAAGDFNTTSAEDIRESILDRYARSRWILAHDGIDPADCRGTQYYAPEDSWSFLDMVLWSPARGDARRANATWQLDPASARCANSLPEQVTPAGTPNRFTMPEATGVSDHWPLIVEIQSE